MWLLLLICGIVMSIEETTERSDPPYSIFDFGRRAEW